MKTYEDLWNYICENGRARECSQFYVTSPNQTALAFWNGMLTALECEGVITKEDAINIWREISA